MARPLILDDNTCARVQIRRRMGGATYAQLQREFRLSKGSVGKALKRKVPPEAMAAAAQEAPPEKPSTETKAERVKRQRERAAARKKAEARGNPERLENMVVMLDELITRAYESEGREADVQTLTSLMRSLKSILELAVKLEPPDVPDPGAHPDMVAAGSRAREKLHAYVGQALEESAAG